MSRPKVSIAATGVANLASMRAALVRAGAEAVATTDADALAEADLAVLPGVGAFGEAMEALRSLGLDLALAERWKRRAPTLGVCLGMQLFFEASEESPDVVGLGILPGTIRRFASGLPLPQLGWNRVAADGAGGGAGAARPGTAEGASSSGGIVEAGWAYFANSYRLDTAPPGCRAWLSDYGERFVAALEAGFEESGAAPAGRPAAGGRAAPGGGPGSGRPALLLCQFHPELSGRWGLGLLRRWIGAAEGSEA